MAERRGRCGWYVSSLRPRDDHGPAENGMGMGTTTRYVLTRKSVVTLIPLTDESWHATKVCCPGKDGREKGKLKETSWCDDVAGTGSPWLSIRPDRDLMIVIRLKAKHCDTSSIINS